MTVRATRTESNRDRDRDYFHAGFEAGSKHVAPDAVDKAHALIARAKIALAANAPAVEAARAAMALRASNVIPRLRVGTLPNEKLLAVVTGANWKQPLSKVRAP